MYVPATRAFLMGRIQDYDDEQQHNGQDVFRFVILGGFCQVAQCFRDDRGLERGVILEAASHCSVP